MTFKKFAVLFSRIIALTLLGILVMIVSSAITPQPEFMKLAATSDSSQSMGMLVLVRFILALIFAFILEKTCLRGFRLMGLMLWVVFGITTFMTQIETLIFGSAFPMLSVNDVFLLVYTSLVETLIFIPFAVLIMGKWKSNG